MLGIVGMLFPIVAVAASKKPQDLVDASMRSLRSWPRAADADVFRPHERFQMSPDGTGEWKIVADVFSKAHPSHVKPSTRSNYPLLVAIAAGVCLVSVVLLALARYFCYNDQDFSCTHGGDPLTFAYFLAVMAAANWSAMNITFHIASNLGLTSIEALFWRSVANFSLASLAVLFSRSSFLPPRNRLWLFIRCSCSVGSVIGLYIAIVQMALVDAVALYALVPFFALLFTYLWFGEPPNTFLTGLVVTSFVGAMLVIQPYSLLTRDSSDYHARLWSSLAAVGSAACAAFGAVVVNAFARDMPANLQVLWFGVLGLLVAPLIMLLQGKVPHEVMIATITQSEDGVLRIVSIIIIGVSSYLMQLAYGWSLELHRAGYITTIFQCSELFMQWAVGILALNETLNPSRAVGVVIVVACSVILIATRPKEVEQEIEHDKDCYPSARSLNSYGVHRTPTSLSSPDSTRDGR